MKNLFLLLLIFFPVTAFTQIAWIPVTYNVTFKIKNVDRNVTGKFTALKTDFRFSPDELGTSHFSATIHAATTVTGVNKKDGDLQNADTIKYTQIEVESMNLYKKGTQFAGMFNVTIKGITRQVEIPFEFNQTGNDAEFRSSFNINSRNFGEGINALTMNEPAMVSIYIKAKS